MQSAVPAASQYRLVGLPPNVAAFRSVRGDPPFLNLLRWLSTETGRDLGFREVALSAWDLAMLRGETASWLKARERLGLCEPGSESQVGFMSIEGVTAPVLNRRLRAGDALVADGGRR